MLRTIIKNKLGRDLSREEFQYAKQLADSVNLKSEKYLKYPVEDVVNTLAEVIVQKLFLFIKKTRVDARNINSSEFDMREFQKNQLYFAAAPGGAITDQDTYATQNNTQTSKDEQDEQNTQDLLSIDVVQILGKKLSSEITNLFNPNANLRKNYLVFDAFTSQTTDGINFQWNYSDTDFSGRYTVNSIGTIRNVISMRIYQPIFPSSVVNTNSKRLAILINEFRAQSIVASGTAAYHFLFRPCYRQTIPAIVLNLDKWVDLQCEKFNDGYYHFYKPITELSTITMTLYDPLTPIQLPIPYDEVSFTYGVTTRLTTSRAYPDLYVPDTAAIPGCFLTEFTTDNPGADANVINRMNTPFGLSIITKIDDYNFIVNVDTSGITPKAGLIIPVYFNIFRFIFALELTYLHDAADEKIE